MDQKAEGKGESRRDFKRFEEISPLEFRCSAHGGRGRRLGVAPKGAGGRSEP